MSANDAAPVRGIRPLARSPGRDMPPLLVCREGVRPSSWSDQKYRPSSPGPGRPASPHRRDPLSFHPADPRVSRGPATAPRARQSALGTWL